MLSFGAKLTHVRDHAFNILGKVQEFVQIIMSSMKLINFFSRTQVSELFRPARYKGKFLTVGIAQPFTHILRSLLSFLPTTSSKRLILLRGLII